MAAKTTEAVAKKTGIAKGTIAELKKVNWPTKQEVVKYTGVVLVTCLIVALVLGLFDLVLGGLFKLLLG